MTQAQAVIETIEALGGIATLNQINQNIFKIKDCVWKTKTPFASIRRIVQLTDGIYKIKPGLYALETHRKQLENEGIVVQTEKNKDSDEVKTAHHELFLKKEALDKHPLVREYLKAYGQVRDLYYQINDILFSGLKLQMKEHR